MNALALGLVLAFVSQVENAKILGIFPSVSYSHYVGGKVLVKELAVRGHEVTFVSSFKMEPPVKNIKDVHIEEILVFFEETRSQILNITEGNFFIDRIMFKRGMAELTEIILNNSKVQQLLLSEEHYDAVIVEDFMVQALKGFCGYFKAPCVLYSSTGISTFINGPIGNPLNPSYIADLSVPYTGTMNFWKRIDNFCRIVYSDIIRNTFLLTIHSTILHKYFSNDLNIVDIFYNASLALINHHVSIQEAVPLVPNAIDIGGFHVTPPKKLPQDLQDFLDNAKNGAIFFSLGSNVRGVDMPNDLRIIFLNVFSKLSQKVLWKFEDENLPGKPDNVKIGKWFPQADILAHPNLKLFITHAGLMSIIETIYHGVPIVGTPIFGDQYTNLALAIKEEYAEGIGFRQVTEEKLLNAILKVLEDPKYTKNIKKKSMIMHDQPMKPLDKAMFWIEYVIRHRGAPHLRTAALNLSWYQYLLLDVIAFVAGVIFTVFATFYYLFVFFCHRRNPRKISLKKKEN